MERINFERLEFFEKRINEIFNQVTEENNLSLEDLDKLFSTNLELKNKYLTEMQANAEDLTFWFNVETQKRKNNSISAIAMSLLSLGIAIFMPSFALVSSLILLFLLRKISKSNKKISQKLDKIDSTAEILNSKLDKLMTTIENNETFIFKLQKELYERKMTELKSNNEGNEKINKATALIEKYMNDGEYPQELDEEIKDLAIKMLQNSITKFIAQYYVELNGMVDAIVFTAGIGENGISLRANIVNSLSNALNIKLDENSNNNIAKFKERQSGVISTPDSKINVVVIPTNEEYMILKDTYEISKLVKENSHVKVLTK